MNCEATKAVEARQQEMQRLGGLEAYRLQALRNLKLKTVVKVRAGGPIRQHLADWQQLPPPAAAACCRRLSALCCLGAVDRKLFSGACADSTCRKAMHRRCKRL